MLYRKLTCLATTAALALCPLALAQTSTKCNPLTTTCPSDDALGGASSSDFTAGAPGDFTSFGPVSYTPSGAVFSVSKSDDSPTLTSNWYIMFGKVSIVVKAASGVGIVSSLVLESDDLDEIDYEWLGSTASSVQSNYFGRGITGSYNRGGVHSAPTSQSAFNTYDVEWTSGQITWSIDGTVVRTLTPAQAAASGNTYPQTPMQVKIGAWSAGDPSNAPGTVAWAGGNTNYAAGPYTMLVQSLMVQDYSTGSQYTYGDMSGTYQSIRSTGGAIGSDYNGSDPPALAGGNYVYVPVPFATGRAGYTATNGSVPWNGTVVTVTSWDMQCGCTKTHTTSLSHTTAPPHVTAAPKPPITTVATTATTSRASFFYTSTPTPTMTSMFTGSAASVGVEAVVVLFGLLVYVG